MRVILEHGREFEFQDFCNYMSDMFLFFGSRPGYYLEQSSYMEGIQTRWRLTEYLHNRFDESNPQVGPLLFYSNVSHRWCGISPSPDMPLEFIDEPIKKP